jgi:hypothetical protein
LEADLWLGRADDLRQAGRHHAAIVIDDPVLKKFIRHAKNKSLLIKIDDPQRLYPPLKSMLRQLLLEAVQNFGPYVGS